MHRYNRTVTLLGWDMGFGGGQSVTPVLFVTVLSSKERNYSDNRCLTLIIVHYSTNFQNWNFVVVSIFITINKKIPNFLVFINEIGDFFRSDI